MKHWVPAILVALAVVAYAFFYALGATESQGTSSFYLANVVGLVVFVIGIIAAGIIIRRATPHT